MRYFPDANTLFIRGSFRATGTGNAGTIVPVSSLLIHTREPSKKQGSYKKDLELAAAGAGIGPDFLALVTTVPMQNLCVLQYDFLTAFILAAGQDRPIPGKERSAINIIICSGRGMNDAGLIETVMIANDAKVAALKSLNHTRLADPSDVVIVACENHQDDYNAGVQTAIKTRVHAMVFYGITEAIRKPGGGDVRNRPSFFIFSRFRGEHWVEWSADDCPYYPCHFPGQRCDFCYCPLYPCGDETLGQWVESSNAGKVWNCARCTMIHEPVISDYLRKHPEASKDELVHIWKSKKTKKRYVQWDPAPV